ncbi:MAG: stage II sporulation protein M [Neisseria sp.]|nr:stage II sporulation protein M [Neisseria sp.]
MKQYDFETRHRTFWAEFEQDVTLLEKGRRIGAQDFARRYRMVCNHLAQAGTRDYSPSLVESLQQLVERAHRVLYRHQEHTFSRFVGWLKTGLPRSVRAEKTVVLWSHILFYAPYLVFFVLCALHPDLFDKVFGISASWQLEASYRELTEQTALNLKRETELDVLMFGFYVMNNIGIAFQTLGGGFLFGIGTMWILVSNGMMIGGASGYMLHSASAPAFFGFVGAHGAFELTGIVLAGAAGLRVGLALINPQGYSRLDALKIQGKSAGLLMGAAFVLLLIAAVIEAFWSSLSVLPPAFKMAVALCLWLAVYGYLLLAGRNKT